MTLELEDKPGQLLKALQPIAERGGNIVSINHQRGKVTPRGTLPVEIDFEILQERLDLVLEDLREHDIRIAEVGEEKFQKSITLILISEREKITEVINRLEKEKIKVVDISIEIPEEGGKNSARLTVNATSSQRLKKAMDSLDTFCKEKDILKIEPVSATHN